MIPENSKRPPLDTGISLLVSDALLERVAERAAELVLARVGSPSPESEYLTVTEAAELLRAKPQRVYDLLSAGRLTRHKDGSRVLIARSELVNHVAPSLPRGSRSRMDRTVAA